MIEKQKAKSKVFTFVFLSIILCLCVFLLCVNLYERGFKNGQVDYALKKIQYTVIEGKIIHIEGNAPKPDIHLTPIGGDK